MCIRDRIATGDYDCIIMSHSQFEKIPISAERKERMLNEQIDEISYAIDEMKERNGERWTVKQMESQKKKLEEQLKSLSDESRKDDLITFEELGAVSYTHLDVYKRQVDDMSELADNLLQLGRTLGEADNFTEYYRAANVTVLKEYQSLPLAGSD